jgi:hypothetical protein
VAETASLYDHIAITPLPKKGLSLISSWGVSGEVVVEEPANESAAYARAVIENCRYFQMMHQVLATLIQE